MSLENSQIRSALSRPPLRRLMRVTYVVPVVASLSAVHALAQDTGLGLDEVVVTARKVEESILDVPVAMSVVGGSELDNFQLSKAQEFATRIPTLNITTGGSGGGAAIYLRGIGSSQISSSFDSAVALNIDGVVVNSARLVQNSFLDLQQIEVLKGPQSLYFGKSASAGVLSFKSRDPGKDFELSGSGSYEFEERGYTAEGIVSGPLTDTLGARVATRYYKADEIMKNDFPGARHPDIGESSLDVRLTLAWEPSDDLKVNMKAVYSHYKNDVSQTFYDLRCTTPGTPARSLYSPLIPLLVPSAGSLAVHPQIYECGAKNQIYTHAEQNPIEAAQMPRNHGGVPYTDAKTYLLRLRGDYDISNSLSLSSVTGYFDLHSEEAAAYSRTTEGGGVGTPINTRQTFSQELRLQSRFDGPFNFQLGGYYENGNARYQDGQTAFGATYALATLYPLLGGAAGPFAAYGPSGADIATGNTYDWQYYQTRDTEAVSLFGSVNFKVTERLTAAGGVRWTEEKKSARFTVPYTHGFLQQVGFTVPNGTQSPLLKFKDDNISWETSLTYALADDVNVYGAYKTGFKSGGIDSSALPTASTFASINACPQHPDNCDVIYDSETAKGFEVGLKSQLFDRSLRLDLVGYRYVFANLQTQQFISTQTLFRTFNVGEITTYGFEADMRWRPVVGLAISGSVGYLHSEFMKDFFTASGDNFNGLRPSNSPKWSGNLGLDYETSVAHGLKLGLGSNISFTGSRYANDDYAGRTLEDSYYSLDLRASIGTEDDRWKVSLVGNNVTDEIWVTNSTQRPFGIRGTPLDESLRENRGRQVFLKVDFRY